MLEKGKLFINKTVTPNVGISPSEVARCIGHNSLDVGTLCTSDKINMWAKYKPFKSSTKEIVSENDRATSNYGIAINTFDASSNLGAILDAAAQGIFGWSTQKPDGSPSEPYRLLDFDGYYHYCKNPFYVDNLSYDGCVKLEIGMLPGLPEGNIQVTDLKEFVGLNSSDNAGYGMIYRINKGTPRHINWFDEVGKQGVLYPITQSNTFEIEYKDGGSFEVCFYIHDENNMSGDDVILVPIDLASSGNQIVIESEKPLIKITDVWFAKDASVNTKLLASFTIATNRPGSTVPSGKASVRIYNINKPNDDLYIWNFDVKTLTYPEKCTALISRFADEGDADYIDFSGIEGCDITDDNLRYEIAYKDSKSSGKLSDFV